ncbi:hypothetical protein LTR08_008701 [Meristemomyces frigidus]|nr:hypothetical protein LTR08_008701 [Meristemomyces frigidus]
MRTRAQAADPTALDLPYLSTTYGIPEPDIQTLIDAPTADLVRNFLASLTTKAQELDTLQADKLKVDVELENTVRTTETKAKVQKEQVKKYAKEVEALRTKLNEAESARKTLSSELEHIRTSTSGSTAETQSLRHRIESLEASNRDALALVEGKTAEKDRLATELSEQHSKLLLLRRDVSQLEERNQSLENAASSHKFKEQSLQQEIELLKRNNEWSSNELQTRTQEHAKFRKERNARIASLQRELEESSAAVETLKRTETTLRQRLDEVQAKADDAFARIASLQEEAARKGQDFRTELDSTKRLAELQAQNAATHKARLQDVHGQVEQIKEDAADEIGRLQAEIETERSDKEQAERKVAELELNVERLEQEPRASRPGTPMRNGGRDPATPGSRAGSPSGIPGSLRKKAINGLTYTAVYEKMTTAQQELELESARSLKLERALEDFMTTIESRGPELLEMKADQENLEQQVLDFSNLLDDAVQTRDAATKEAQHWQNQASAAGHEGDVLRRQLRDLSAQIRMLLVEVQSRDQGLSDMSASERLALERAARGELEGEALEHLTDTGRFIAERLVIFRDVSEMQEKNQHMLKIIEDLGDRLEGEEAQQKERQTAAFASENDELKQKVQRLQDELQATVQQIDSYMKERDMFRRMLQHRGQLAPDADLQTMFGQSVGGPPTTPQRSGGNMEPPATPRSKDVSDLNKLIREQQTFFDQYRNESATDRRTLKDQVDALAREKSSLQADIARAQSQLTLAGERYEMLQSNFAALRNENGELAKRSSSMAENAAKQDLRTQQVAEELVEARSMTESLRNENANGKAERELWKRIEARLTEDNRGLVDERSRLSKLVTDLQNLANERELAEGEARKRLLVRTEGLEGELAEVRAKLEREGEEGRKIVLRREYEEGQSRTRIDDLVRSLGNVREELIAAKTARDQLQVRVEEMKTDLKAAEEKVGALQPRQTPRSETLQQQDGEDDEELPAEQRLAIEASELRRELELARNELEAARGQIEQYRSIAQSTEEDLANFTETSEQYKEDTDRLLAERDARVEELEQRTGDLDAELTTTNNELSELRTKHDDASRALAEQREASEAELARLRDDGDRHVQDKTLFREDLKAQAEIAQQAQQAYEDELLKHAEAARALQGLRREYGELRTEVAGVRAEAEGAREGLALGEASWEEQRGVWERECGELRGRRADVEEQNRVLHRQIEGFSRELKGLREGRAGGEAGAGSPGGVRSEGAGDMQEVVRFLRREKEIVDVQFELSVQDGKRVQQQLEYASAQLEECRGKLAEERRAKTEQIAGEGSASKLMQTINELNLFRESSTTLREEARQARVKVEAKGREVEGLREQMEPLKQRVGELELELEGVAGELKLLGDDRDHWRERTQNIISKYDRVDPAELEALKAQLESLAGEKAGLEGEVEGLRAQVEGFEAVKLEAVKQNTAVFEDKLERYKEQAKEQNRKQNDRKRETAAQLEVVRGEKALVEGVLEGVRGELEGVKAALQEARAEVQSNGRELEEVKAALQEAKAEVETKGRELGESRTALREAETKGTEDGEVHEDGEVVVALRARVLAAEGEAARVEALDGQVATLQGRVQELEGQVVGLNQQLEAARRNSEAAQVDDGALETLRRDLATARQEAESLRAGAQSAAATAEGQTQTLANAQPAEGEKSAAEQVSEAVAQLKEELERQHAVSLKQVEDDRDRKLTTGRENLKRQLAENKEKFREEGRQELVVQHQTELERLNEAHEAVVQKLKEEHQLELEKLAKTGGAAVEKAEEGVKAEQANEEKPLELSDDQIRELLQSNQRAKIIFTNNVFKKVHAETDKLRQAVAEKEEAIETLKAAQQGSASDTADKDELTRKLEAAQKDKEVAVHSAIDNAEKKAKVQVSQRDIAQAKLSVVRLAAKETPDKAVGEVWEVADKAKPVPKPAAVAASSSPVKLGNAPPLQQAPPMQQAPPLQSSPVQSSPVQQPTAPAPGPVAQTPEQVEQAKLRARQARFAPGPNAQQQVSGPTTTSMFGQPSQGGPRMQQPPRRPSAAAAAPAQAPTGTGSPNPQALAFTPGGAPNGPSAQRTSSGIPQFGVPRGGGSNVPRGAGPAGRGGSGGGGAGMSIQGAATQLQRGGGPQSGLPRGGGRGGRGGGENGGHRGGAPGAGQKRPFDGSEGGSEKRPRGGGGPGAGA